MTMTMTMMQNNTCTAIMALKSGLDCGDRLARWGSSWQCSYENIPSGFTADTRQNGSKI